MLYALRNNEGRITGLSETNQEGAEAVDLNNADVRAFLSVGDDTFTPDSYLDQSDIGIARIVEDLIELLVSRNLILFTDLPDMAQRKLLTRKLARGMISKNGDDSTDAFNNDSSILSEEDDSWL